MSEIWILKDNITLPDDPTQLDATINFTSDNQSFVRICIQDLPRFSLYALSYIDTEGLFTGVYDRTSGYDTTRPGLKTINFETSPTGNLLTWLQTNATKQATIYEHIKKDNNKVQVDSAIRDGNGNKIDTTYIKCIEQTLTTAQQEQAKENINAGSPNTILVDNKTFITERTEVLTQAEFDAKQSAGTLEEGVIYNIIGEIQDKLISGENIKTLNNQSLLGSGNIDINSAVWGNITGTLSNQTDLQSALDTKSTVSVSATGTSTTEAKYLIINGVEYKLAGGIETAVSYEPQVLTAAQQLQARTNINASEKIVIEFLEEDD